MKNYFLISLLLIICSSALNAQDYIYLRSGNGRVEASDVTVNASHTTYKKHGDESGKIIAIDNDDISMILFKNGNSRFFEKESKAMSRINFKKNLINYHLLELVVNNFKLSYERILENGKLGIQIPFAIGYGDSDRISGFDDVYNTFYTGITLNFYPTGQGKVRYFMGPSIQAGTGYFNDGYYDYTNDIYIDDNIDTYIFRFLINNGVMFTPIDALSISLIGSLGIRYTTETDFNDDQNIKTVGAASVNLSYRF